MAKWFCTNEQCNNYDTPIDIDMSIISYHVDFEGDKYLLKNKKLLCKHCKSELSFVDTNKEKALFISSNYSRMTHAEKMQVLKNRSKDTRIQANKEILERKQYLDKN